MPKSIYVGNLPWSTKEQELFDLFADFGEVISVKIITDRETGRSRGFAFVEMEESGVSDAIASLNNKEFGGRVLRINEAKPQDR